jgi:hypothetical protein
VSITQEEEEFSVWNAPGIGGICDDAGLEPRAGWFGKGACISKSSSLSTEGEEG